MIKTTPFIIAFLLTLSAAIGQVDKFRMANAYEEGGDHRNAARIYLELYESADERTRRAAFDGIVRTFQSLQNYQALRDIVVKEYELRPSTSLALLAASLSVRSGDMQGADQWWKKAEDLKPPTEALYAEMGRDQRQLLLFDRAVASFTKARTASGQPLSYARELAELYNTQGRTELAVQEVLNMHEMNANTQATEGMLSALMASDSAARIVGDALDRRELPAGNRLRLWYRQHVGDWETALELAKRIDEEEGLRGNEILRFAGAARREGAYAEALKAYQLLFNANEQVAMAAAYGYARTLDEQMAKSTTIDREKAEDILGQYRRIIEKYPDHPLSAEALLRSAMLNDRALGNTDAARDLLTRLTNRWRGTESAQEGALLLANIYYANGRADAAEDLLRGVVELDIGIVDFRDLAMLKLADLALFRGSTDSATTIYAQLAGRPSSIAANDAIERLGLLLLRQEDSLGVETFIKGLDLSEQRRYTDAARTFADAAERAVDNDVADRCRLEASRTYIALGSDADAERFLEPLIARIPASIFGDRALVLAADILERRGDREGAITALTTLLVQYPRSILAPETRERIRRLRGDA